MRTPLLLAIILETLFVLTKFNTIIYFVTLLRDKASKRLIFTLNAPEFYTPAPPPDLAKPEQRSQASLINI